MSSVKLSQVEESRTWKVETFGDITISFRGALLPPFTNRKVAQLLLLLASKADRPISRDLVAETLWPGEYLEIAKDRLRQTLSLLNKHFKESGQEGPIESTRTTICLSTRDCEVDLIEFYSLLEQAPSDYQSLIEAIQMVEKPIGEGFVEDWIREIRESTIVLVMSRLRRVIEALKKQENIDTLLEVCAAGIKVAPMDDGFNFERFAALMELGRQSDAILVKQTFEEKLQHQLGLKPSSRWTEQSFDLVTANPSRKKAQDWISLSQPVDRFFGRESEIKQLNITFDSKSTARLVTITGQGGSGKTRLSLEFIRQLESDVFDRVVAIGLAEFDSVGQVARAIAESFEVVLFHEDGLSGLVSSVISNSRILFVFDNCEHLIPEISNLVRSLATECSSLSILCSSRTKLGIHGESELALEPLLMPNDQTNEGANPVIQLLIDRIRSRDHTYEPDQAEFEELNELGRLLEGVPLALELAASQTGILSVRELRLSLQGRVLELGNEALDMPARHLTLRNTLTWGFERLSVNAQKALSLLSLFPGPWKFSDALAILQRDDLAEIHEELKGAALISTVPNSRPKQFRMLEMVRHFVAEQLSKPESLEFQQRHFELFRQKALALHDNLLAIDQKTRVFEFRADLSNYRMAIQTGLRGATCVDDLMLIVLRTSLLAEPVGLLAEWAEYARKASELPSTSESERGTFLGFICHSQALHGSPNGHESLLREVLDLSKLEANPFRRSYMVNQACNLIAMKEYREFVNLAMEVLEVAAANCQDSVQAINHSLSKAQLLGLAGNYESAVSVVLTAIDEAERLGAHREFLWTNVRLAEFYINLNQPKKAIERVLSIAGRFNETDDRLVNVWLAKVLIFAMSLAGRTPSLSADTARLIGFEEARRMQYSVIYPSNELLRLRDLKQECRLVISLEFDSLFATGAGLEEAEARTLIESFANRF